MDWSSIVTHLLCSPPSSYSTIFSRHILLTVKSDKHAVESAHYFESWTTYYLLCLSLLSSPVFLRSLLVMNRMMVWQKQQPSHLIVDRWLQAKINCPSSPSSPLKTQTLNPCAWNSYIVWKNLKQQLWSSEELFSVKI